MRASWSSVARGGGGGAQGTKRRGRLVHIDLSGASLSEPLAAALGRILEEPHALPGVRSLDIAKNRLCAAGVVAVVRGCAAKPGLTALNLSQVGVEPV